ncbi:MULTISPECIES: NfeD family protein [Bosea]|uniref:NfeD family protein n=1 Tax=Bosea TaxID=85413 RepID=UPI00215020F1|nr:MULTISPECIES: NfeD family protein [Bosea]MCR4522445.1 NfeD family protein [Bosea sp. 47.2.35]MDR6829086.1 membrane protein implicated in regulation of membrane protease activity [Bosea robiniae]MDR6895970.1 membrane protein implicated in regulation of membrane protease activity [Bosea sp. BE109]MDR7139367.1 membrane protein implicated in regulation of membrane protease activity [Bosea sp. BE168]MDR7176065.1 membrane protein implicated in regulation of membrane protease activity [Bosea sp. B
MLEGLANLGGWSWAILGLVLIGGEMLAPGVFLIWLGLAALVTGAVVGLFGLGWQAACIVFAILAIACVAAGRLLTRRKAEEPDAATGLNDRGRQLIGKVFRLETTMAGGEGRVRVGDSSWRIVGPELLAGAEVKVVRVEGSTLIVERA